MKVNIGNTAQVRGGRSIARKMTVEMPAETLTALKVYAARRQTTVREIVIEAVGNHLKREGEQA
jgi:hypothetical protein